jgi:hypothetical protein
MKMRNQESLAAFYRIGMTPTGGKHGIGLALDLQRGDD